MSDSLGTDIQRPRLYEVKILIRGYRLSLQQFKDSFDDLRVIIEREGQLITSNFIRPENQSEGEFHDEKLKLRQQAFRVTVSIVGHNDVTIFGDGTDAFNESEIPFPIKTIYMTNETAFKSFANGNAPRNSFKIWVHFHKPPFLDPTSIVSDQTINLSEVIIKAEDMVFLGAVRDVVVHKFHQQRLWYYPIHQKFSYDIGLWFLALPYILVSATDFVSNMLPGSSRYSNYRWIFVMYLTGLGIFLYRILFSYMKWALPLNVLNENKDIALRHRIFFGTVVIGIIINAASKLIGL